MNIDCCKAFAILVIVFIVYEMYRHMYPTLGVRKWWDGVCKNIAMHKEKNAKHKVKNTIKVSAGFVRESLTALFATLMALWILGFVFDIWSIQYFTNQIIEKIHANLVIQYPLITTIIGAFIALLCDYFIIHPKIYVSPNAFFAKVQTDNEKKRRLLNGILKIVACLIVWISISMRINVLVRTQKVIYA